MSTSDEDEDIQATLAADESGAEVDAEKWKESMASDGFYVDHAFIRLTANYLNRDIMILPLDPKYGNERTGWIEVSAKKSGGKIYMLYYHQGEHYQSIVPKEKSLLAQATNAIVMESGNPPKRPRRQ